VHQEGDCPVLASLFLLLLIVNQRGKVVRDTWPLKGKVTRGKKKKGWIEIRPRFKIQYPMKNQGENIRVNTEKQE
jgi:hypothetical protein